MFGPLGDQLFFIALLEQVHIIVVKVAIEPILPTEKGKWFCFYLFSCSKEDGRLLSCSGPLWPHQAYRVCQVLHKYSLGALLLLKSGDFLLSLDMTDAFRHWVMIFTENESFAQCAFCCQCNSLLLHICSVCSASHSDRGFDWMTDFWWPW